MIMAAIIEKEEIDQYKSKWGNRYNEVSVDDLLNILYGKVLYLYDGEYATFIYLKEQTEE